MLRVSDDFFCPVPAGVKVTGVALEVDKEGLDILESLVVEARRVLNERSVEQKLPWAHLVTTPRLPRESGDEMHQLKIVEV